MTYYFSYYTRATGVNLVYITMILYAIIYRPQYTNSLNYTFEKGEYHEHNNNNIIQYYVIIYV